MFYFNSHCKFLCLSFEKISVKLYITITNNIFVLISQFDILLIKKRERNIRGNPLSSIIILLINQLQINNKLIVFYVKFILF